MQETALKQDVAAGPNKRAIVEALVLAFSHSEAKHIVGTDALRLVLDARYIDMVKTKGSLDLQPLWQILESQPGFVAQAAVPPICAFKQWEEKLGVQVLLPKHMGAYGRHEVSFQSSKCRVPDTALQRALLSGTVAGTQASAPTVSAAPVQAVEEVRARGKLVKAGLAVGAVVLLITISAVLTFRTSLKELKPSDFAGEIPVAEARLMQDTVGAVLSDGKWLAKPEAERKQHIQLALERLGQKGVFHLVIMDPTGKMAARASANSGSVQITFFLR